MIHFLARTPKGNVLALLLEGPELDRLLADYPMAFSGQPAGGGPRHAWHLAAAAEPEQLSNRLERLARQVAGCAPEFHRQPHFHLAVLPQTDVCFHFAGLTSGGVACLRQSGTLLYSMRLVPGPDGNNVVAKEIDHPDALHAIIIWSATRGDGIRRLRELGLRPPRQFLSPLALPGRQMAEVWSPSLN